MILCILLNNWLNVICTSSLLLITQFWIFALQVCFKGIQAASITLEFLQVCLQLHSCHPLGRETVLSRRRDRINQSISNLENTSYNFKHFQGFPAPVRTLNYKTDAHPCKSQGILVLALASIIINIFFSFHFAAQLFCWRLLGKYWMYSSNINETGSMIT